MSIDGWCFSLYLCTFSYYCTFEIFHCACVVGVVVVGFTFCYHFHCRYLYLITTTLLHSLCVECLFVVIPCTTGSNAQKMPHTKCKRKTIECNERRIAFAQRSDEMLQLKENNSQSETKPNREKKRKSNFVRWFVLLRVPSKSISFFFWKRWMELWRENGKLKEKLRNRDKEGESLCIFDVCITSNCDAKTTIRGHKSLDSTEFLLASWNVK